MKNNKSNHIQSKNKSISFIKRLDLWDKLLLILCAFVFVSHTFYVLSTHQFPKWDEHLFVTQAVDIHKVFTHWPLNLQPLVDTFRVRQPIYSILIALGTFIFGVSHVYKISLELNALFYCLTIGVIYLLSQIFLSKKSSFLGAFIFACYGFPLFYFHFAYSETLATLSITLAFLFLAKSHKFSDRRYTALFAISFLLGNLVRWTIGLFLLGPFFVVFLTALQKQLSKKTQYRKTFAINIVIIICISIILPLLIYYLPYLSSFMFYLTSNAQYSSQWVQELAYLPPGLSQTYSIHSIMFYFNILSQQSIFFFLLFVFGFFISLFHVKKFLFFLASFIVTYMIFTFLFVLKDDRYIVPMYPTMAILSAVTFDYMYLKKIKQVIIVGTVVLGVLNFLAACWGIGPLGQQGLKDIIMPSFIPHPRRIYLTTIIWPPRPDEMRVHEIYNMVLNDYHNTSKDAYLLNTFSYEPQEFDNALGSVAAYEDIHSVAPRSVRFIKRGDYQTLFSRFKTADYIIVKEKRPMSSESLLKNEDDKMVIHTNEVLEKHSLPSTFVLIKKVYVPLFKTTVLLYKKTKPITQSEWEQFAHFFVEQDPPYKDIILQGIQTKTVAP